MEAKAQTPEGLCSSKNHAPPKEGVGKEEELKKKKKKKQKCTWPSNTNNSDSPMAESRLGQDGGLPSFVENLIPPLMYPVNSY